MVFYLRVLLGFMLAASVVLGFYAFAGISTELNLNQIQLGSAMTWVI